MKFVVKLSNLFPLSLHLFVYVLYACQLDDIDDITGDWAHNSHKTGVYGSNQLLIFDTSTVLWLIVVGMHVNVRVKK